jgi:hypothetical protein
MLKPLRDMILVAKGVNLSKKLIWTEERIAAFKECQLYFLDDTTTPIRGYVESFENSSFTRPSGGAFEVTFAKIQKMKKGFVELNLKSH